jgi:hypothetical protein
MAFRAASQLIQPGWREIVFIRQAGMLEAMLPARLIRAAGCASMSQRVQCFAHLVSAPRNVSPQNDIISQRTVDK